MQKTASSLDELSASYGLYAKALMRHCYARTWHREDAEELVQETFMNAFEYVNRGNTIDDLRVFLYKVANNLIIDRARFQKRQREKEVSLDVLCEKGFELSSGDPLSRIQRKLEARKILGAAKNLTQEDYRLFVLRFVDGLTPVDISRITGQTANCISVRLHRAVKQIAALYITQRKVQRRKKS